MPNSGRFCNSVSITCRPLPCGDAIKAADVAWFSLDRFRHDCDPRRFTTAPEICVEVLSPSNRDDATREQAALYFAAGAGEVWLCHCDGRVSFHPPAGLLPHPPAGLLPHPPASLLPHSPLCPAFPARIAAP